MAIFDDPDPYAVPFGPIDPPAGPDPTAAPPAPRRWNTTPDWQDPYNPPSPGDPYWAAWIAVNPDYRGQGYTGPTPPPGPNPTPGTQPLPGLGPLLAPFDKPFKPEPSPPPFEFPDFQLPSGTEVLNDDPGYLFRVNQGTQALTNSAAAKHTLRSGATLKNFLDFGQQLGSQEYGNAVDRRYNVWSANRSNRLGIYGTAVDKNKLDWQHGFDTWSKDFDIYKWNHEFPARVLGDAADRGIRAASGA